MKRFLLLTTLLSVSQINAADPPSKRGGGFLGFGSRKSEQLSSGLFPESGGVPTPADRIVTATPRPATETASSSSSGGNNIFRSGQAEKVSMVSYVIQDGRKIDKPIETTLAVDESAANPGAPTPSLDLMTSSTETEVELAKNEGRKRGGFLGLGRRHDEKEDEVVTPVPASGGIQPLPVAAPSAPLKSTPSVATPLVESAPTPNFAHVEEEKEEKTSWIPFLSRRKKNRASEREAAAPAPAVIATAEPISVATKTASTTTSKPAAEPTASKPTASKPDASKPDASKPDATKTAAATPSTTFEVPRNEAKKEEKKDTKPGVSGGGLLSPIANIRVPRKEIDLSSAETIIQNGEIVAESPTNFKTVPKAGPATQPQAPRVVNGVKTYTSWDDVNARSTSAADKIIGSMR